MLKPLRYRPGILVGTVVAALCGAAAASRFEVVTACLVGWDCGVLAYGAALVVVIRRSTADRLQRVAEAVDASRWTMLLLTLAATVASLGAIIAELARSHGTPHQDWPAALSALTVILSWFFVHTVFATHYAHEFWRRRGLSFPGNDRPGYGEFLYFGFCIAVASQVSDVATQSAGMRRLVLVHSIVSYLFNAAIIALGVNVGASLVG